MKETLTTCAKCGGNACSEMTDGRITIWICMGCGFTSNTTIIDSNVEQMEATLPELYKALRFKDADGKYWYPNSVMLEDKSMAFAEGTSVDDWKYKGKVTATMNNDGSWKLIFTNVMKSGESRANSGD